MIDCRTSILVAHEILNQTKKSYTEKNNWGREKENDRRMYWNGIAYIVQMMGKKIGVNELWTYVVRMAQCSWVHTIYLTA